MEFGGTQHLSPCDFDTRNLPHRYSPVQFLIMLIACISSIARLIFPWGGIMLQEKAFCTKPELRFSLIH